LIDAQLGCDDSAVDVASLRLVPDRRGDRRRGGPCLMRSRAIARDAEREMREAIAFHLEGLLEQGEPIPEPTPVAAVMLTTPAA